MSNPLHLAYPAACPDCPGARLDTLSDLVGATKESCAFDTARVDARAFVPPGWRDRYGFGLVRRGVLIRQRIDASGAAVAIDAAGPGCLFPIDGTEASASTPCDYAATDVVVCLCRRTAVDQALDESHKVGRELLDLQSSAMARVERFAHARGAATVKEKVSLVLLTLAHTLTPPRERDRLPSDLQQRDMSRLIGIRHETFCRVLTGLERDGAIRRESDGLRLVDPAALG